MPDVADVHEPLSLLFDREAMVGIDSWLPPDTQLTRWVGVALHQALPAMLDTTEQLSDLSVEISLNCVSRSEMRNLNAQYRNKDSVTNVLSFPADMPIVPDEGGSGAQLLPLGDVVICPAVLEEEAEQQHKRLEHHWAHLVVHSVLHLNGLDHETENAAQTMESLEIQILSELGIANPYLAASAKNHE